VTFKKADEYRRVVAAIPIEQIMVETDAPYMAPEPHRGKRCETAFVVDTARRIAEVKGLTLETIAEQTGKNADRLFGLNRHA
jgi:TatD DNase family protein